MKRTPKHTPKRSRKLMKHMSNNSFELVAGRKHLIFKSQINGSKIVLAHSTSCGRYRQQINKLIVQYHGTVDNAAVNGRLL